MTELQQTVERDFAGLYETALLGYLVAPDEAALLQSYDLGRCALTGDVGLLDLIATHFRAVSSAMKRTGSHNAAAERLVGAQTVFLLEALSSFEMARRAFHDTNTVLRRLNDVLEAQAKQIGYSLHAEAGQLLASVHFALAEASRDIPAENKAHLDNVRTMLLEIERRLRNLSHELRPPVLDDIGLLGALDILAQGVTSRWGLTVSVEVTIDGKLPAAIENTIYRVLQEALTNAAKHASASHATVHVRQSSRQVVCGVRDDGSGFDDTAALRRGRPGLGLAEMKERVGALGGTVHVRRNDNGGTDLTFTIPLDR